MKPYKFKLLKRPQSKKQKQYEIYYSEVHPSSNEVLVVWILTSNYYFKLCQPTLFSSVPDKAFMYDHIFQRFSFPTGLKKKETKTVCKLREVGIYILILELLIILCQERKWRRCQVIFSQECNSLDTEYTIYFVIRLGFDSQVSLVRPFVYVDLKNL